MGPLWVSSKQHANDKKIRAAVCRSRPALYSAVAALMRLRRGCWWKSINSEHWFTRVEPRHCLSLPFPDLLFCHSDKDINVTITHQMKFILAAGDDKLARSQRADPNRAAASFHAWRNFLSERSQHLSDAQWLRRIRNLVPALQMYHFNESLVFRKNHLTASETNQHVTQPESHLK